MQTMILNEVQVYNIPSELGADVISELNVIVSFAKLYNLAEFDYEKRFVTKSAVIEGDCPHCEGAHEIGIDLLQVNEIALVPCVCNEEHIGYNLTDTLTAVTAPIQSEAHEPLHGTETTVEILQPNVANLPETIGDTLVTQATNQVAVMKLMGYDLSDVAQGLPTQAYQFLVIGNHDVDTFMEALTTVPQFAGQGLKVIPMAVGVTPDMTEMEIEVPRVLTTMQLIAMRNIKDLSEVREVTPLVALIEENLTGTELAASQIHNAMGNYSIDVNLFKSFVRAVVSQAKIQNARYDIINPNNYSRIATAYYHHTETNQYYMCTLDFEPNAQEPTDYMISRVPQPTERVITTADFVCGADSLIADLRRVL